MPRRSCTVLRRGSQLRSARAEDSPRGCVSVTPHRGRALRSPMGHKTRRMKKELAKLCHAFSTRRAPTTTTARPGTPWSATTTVGSVVLWKPWFRASLHGAVSRTGEAQHCRFEKESCSFVLGPRAPAACVIRAPPPLPSHAGARTPRNGELHPPLDDSALRGATDLSLPRLAALGSTLGGPCASQHEQTASATNQIEP